ncbi:WXG100 family type VII secretion target [Frankineae bacterium MT45]|nr:WXG100 family type VII secretion target [Frankineae bacterium MT45]
MTGAFNTEAATMAQAASRVTDVNHTISTELRTLFSSVEAVQAHWSGQAAASFQQLMARWNEDSLKLNQALAGISEQIAQSGKAYHASDEANTSAIRSAGSGLNL